jgi:hypothetical protein
VGPTWLRPRRDLHQLNLGMTKEQASYPCARISGGAGHPHPQLEPTLRNL